MNISFTDNKTRNASAPNLPFITIRSGAVNRITKEHSPPIDSTAKPGETNGEASKVEVVIGIILAILIVLTSIAVIGLILHLRKSIQNKKQNDDHSYSTLSRENTQRTESLNAPTNLYDQIQLSPSTGQAEIISKAEIKNINTLSSHQTVDTEQCNKTTEQGSVSTSEQPTYAAVKKKNE